MKDKNIAGLLALFLGGFGIHRFYLGQTGPGILHLVFCWNPISWIVGLISAILLFTMSQEKFDGKYNQPKEGATAAYNKRETDFDRTRPKFGRHHRNAAQKKAPPYRLQRIENRKLKRKIETLRKEGLLKYKDFDFEGAIEKFSEIIKYFPGDVAAHFNLACAFSLTEKAQKSFYHLDQAVAHGFDDFTKIKQHDALAYLRIQNEFDTFEKNQFRLSTPTAPDDKAAPELTTEENLMNSSPDLLDQLRKLGELRQQGHITEEEFADQKKKLLG